MIAFYREYSILPQSAAKLEPLDMEAVEILQPSVAQLALPQKIIFGLPWFHHVILIEKVKHVPTRYWYAQQALEQGWSRDTLTVQIKNRAHERHREPLSPTFRPPFQMFTPALLRDCSKIHTFSIS